MVNCMWKKKKVLRDGLKSPSSTHPFWEVPIIVGLFPPRRIFPNLKRLTNKEEIRHEHRRRRKATA